MWVYIYKYQCNVRNSSNSYAVTVHTKEVSVEFYINIRSFSLFIITIYYIIYLQCNNTQLINSYNLETHLQGKRQMILTVPY